jgi:uncharacterized membrane protein YdjX (TVP38/TMEM64 family)
LDLADRWFDRFGEVIVFVSRLLPAIRTFIAFPAGVARMNLKKFIIYTFAVRCLGVLASRTSAKNLASSGTKIRVEDALSSIRFRDWNRDRARRAVVDLAALSDMQSAKRKAKS